MLDRGEIQIGRVVFDPVTRDLRDPVGQHIELRNKSSEVLSQLATQAGQILSKQILMDAVWPDVTVTDENVAQCVAEIRKAIGDKNHTLIETHVGKGYRLNTGSPIPRLRLLGSATLLVACVLVAVIATGIWWFADPDPLLDDKPRIAVLAFDDLSAGGDRGWLSDGIAEGVITELARYREFLVISRNSSFSFREQPTDVVEISTKLDADYIVEGSKQKSGNRLRVTVQLLSGRDGTHIWAHEYDADIGELFDVQSQIVRSISVQIGRELVWNAPRAGGRNAVTAMDLFGQGNAAFKESTPESLAKAAALYQKSIDADPKQPFGYSGMATLIWHETSNPNVYADMPINELLNMGFEFANKAIEVDRDYYRSHIALGDLHAASGNFEDAFLSYIKAAELNPSSGEAMAIAAEPLLYMDRADEAIEWIERAIDVNPVVPGWYRNIQARTLWWADRCDEGLTAIKKRRRMRQWDYRAMIMNLICLDRIDEAHAAGLELLEHDPDFTVSGHESRVIGMMPPKYAERWLANLRAAGLPET